MSKPKTIDVSETLKKIEGILRDINESIEKKEERGERGYEAERGTKFIVQFKDLEIPKDIAMQIEKKIREVVMSSIATLDLNNLAERDGQQGLALNVSRLAKPGWLPPGRVVWNNSAALSQGYAIPCMRSGKSKTNEAESNQK